MHPSSVLLDKSIYDIFHGTRSTKPKENFTAKSTWNPPCQNEDINKILEQLEDFSSITNKHRDSMGNLSESQLVAISTYLLTYPLRPQWDIRPQQCFATRFCLLLRPEPHPRTAPSLSARPLLIVAMSSLAVLVSFFQVVSISVPLWGCCLGAFAEHALAILVVCV